MNFLLKKIKYHRRLKRFFKLVEDFLDDGYYRVNGNNVNKIKCSEAPFYKRFKINTKGQKLSKYKSGSLFFTRYKYGFLTIDKAFYFINDSQRYFLYKQNYLSYKKQLAYPSIDLDFCDKRMLVYGPIVVGTIFKDSSHFNSYLNLLFQYAENSSFVWKEFAFDENAIKLPWYVQHGDCKNANIVWQDDNSFTMIDLEAIDLYPPLYDIFYYLFITQKEQSIELLKSGFFSNKVNDFFSTKMANVPKNILDICLANYAYFTSRNLNVTSELYEFEFYLFWRKYDSFIDFPLTKKVLNDYQEKIRRYGIK